MDYTQTLAEADALEARAQELRATAQTTKQTSASKDKTLRGWLGFQFESSSGLTEEFANFARNYKKFLSHLKGLELAGFSRGHFYISAFLKNTATGKLVYISSSDVRYFRDKWYNDVLIRTAEHDKDYTGGSNERATLDTLEGEALRLTA